jgi:hypothetical protein
MHREIVDFNTRLVRISTNRYDLLEYITQINELNRSNSNYITDLDFMKELLSFIEQDACCIPHTLLVKYGILSDNKNNSFNTKRLLEQYNFIIDEDFRLLNVEESNSGGRTHATNYLLHPIAFKLCLMRAKNTTLYSKYYLLLEKSIKYYHDYQLMYKDYLLNQKDDKIDNLSKEIDEIKQLSLDQSKVMLDQTNQIQELLGYAKDTKDDISTLLDFSLEQAEQSELHNLEIKKVVNDRINGPITSSNVEQLILFKVDNAYYVVRGTLSYIKAKFRSLTGITYSDRKKSSSNTNYIYVETFENVPNARHLYRALSKFITITVKGNSFTTDDSEPNIIKAIQNVFDKRLTITIEQEELLVAKRNATKKVKSVNIKTKK